MRYSYVPGSIVAHDRAMLPPPPVADPELACRILTAQHEVPAARLSIDGRKLAERVEWSRVTMTLAERLATMELIETHVLWLRHGPVWAHVTWTGGRAPQVVVRRPYLHKVTLEALQVMLGFLTIEYGGCGRCGADRIRLKQDGTLGAHKRKDWRVPLTVACPGRRKRLKSAHSCRLCGRWLEGEWSTASAAGRVQLQHEMDQGCCDVCPPPPGEGS